jgi:hypothetical protein
MSRARVFLAVLSCLCLLTGSALAIPVICQPGRQSLPLPMGSNIGPDVIGPNGYCDWRGQHLSELLTAATSPHITLHLIYNLIQALQEVSWELRS